MSYAGDVTPTEAWSALEEDPRAVLVDVRTHAEWSYVGLPDLRPLGREVVRIEWQRYPDGRVNERFVDELAAAGIERDQPLYFLCRSGVRSIAAAEAATARGWAQSYNVSEGFEGGHGPDHHRTVSGWKVAGLPWVQG
ncbi:rhodanese-like domain-containing protein [Intrasporangium calvum]|uniref:Rhodanese domain protein n=1 Tax=Intrasporangium calvum (strain ATCC 23552 / DSM 43043 / JCM 3097 / NBRC 12989 / NCIMB 10167 / NRRL B-3866 / 7 KIP) TaxID=710696 RepID=E6SCI0_INTC7|nr:rhodanese-like domain-containing protein [Intrasporangium calvum]ADU48559.1 Rhodanese domain protein [Intrasporangium calvum DSM 43043]AXG13571.1 rhodanese-like domain-containing protein [Intrasporangium calvum]